MSALIKLSHISKVFTEGNETTVALDDISLTVNAGELLILVGPSGCGKSTILRIMSGLEKNFEGTLTYAKGVTKSDFGFVFQQFALLPWLTVKQNVELGLIARNIPEPARIRRVMRELKRLGLDKFADHYPRELSGGMKQRVGIARAFATDPKVIFMDEAFSELDSFTAEELRDDLLTMWHERKPTIILVTHLVSEAIKLADRIAVLTPRPGRIEKILKNDLPRPRAKRSPEFFALEDKVMNIIKP
jgi:NitT/TauT family transport system ATP-binding protein